MLEGRIDEISHYRAHPFVIICLPGQAIHSRTAGHGCDQNRSGPQTAIAEITVQAILNPSPTSEIKNSTPVPDGEISSVSSAPTISPSATLEVASPTPEVPLYTCEIDYFRSLPEDGPQKAGAQIRKTWVIRNTGNTAWSGSNVEIKWVGGINLCDRDSIEWSAEVKPGETFAFNLDLAMLAMATDKLQIVQWGLVDPAKNVFCKLYFVIPYTY